MAASSGADGSAWPLGRGFAGAAPGTVGRDLLAGLTLAAIAVPEQMATTRLAGLDPKVGLIAFVAATAGFIAFGANRVLSAGADSTIAPIFAGSLALLAATGSPQYAALAATLALMVGALLVLAAVLRLGWIADLLSRPVMIGFLAAIAVHIVISQTPSALGVVEDGGDVFRRLTSIVSHVGQINWICAVIAALVFAVSFVAERLSPRLPGALMALAAATAASAMLGLHAHGVPALGRLAPGFPTVALPDVGLETLRSLAGLAAVVALVVMVQTAATTRSFPGGGTGADVSRDFLGLGAGGLLAGLLGAFPVNASPPRTAAVAAARGKTQLGGLCAALAVLALAAFGGGVIAATPTAALAGVLFFIAERIVHWDEFGRLLRRAPTEFSLSLATLILIVLLPIATGVAIGVFLSLAHGVFTITRARLTPYERIPGTTVWWPAKRGGSGEMLADVQVMGFQAPLLFLNAEIFRRDFEQAIDAASGTGRLLVLEASNIVEIDVTAADVLTALIVRARARGVEVAIARLESVRAQSELERYGVADVLGRDHLFASVAQATDALCPRTPAVEGADGAIRL